MGCTGVAFFSLLLEEHDLVGVGALQSSLGFKDFHHATDCSSPPAVTQNDDRQPCGGEGRAGLWPPPCPQLQGCSSSVLRGRASRVAVLPSTWAGDPLLPPAFGGEGRSLALWRRRTATCCLVRVWLSVHRTGDGRVVRRPAMSMALPAPPAAPGGRTTRRTPRGRCSCSWIVLSSLLWRGRE
mgnify:CR=1 FL=1